MSLLSTYEQFSTLRRFVEMGPGLVWPINSVPSLFLSPPSLIHTQNVQTQRTQCVKVISPKSLCTKAPLFPFGHLPISPRTITPVGEEEDRFRASLSSTA